MRAVVNLDLTMYPSRVGNKVWEGFRLSLLLGICV